MQAMNNSQGVGARPKQFTYSTSVEWCGERKGVLASGEKGPITVSSPPEFKGAPGYWTPEDMFVGALEMCQLLTFLALAKRSNLTVLSYVSSATGTLEFVERSFRSTKVTIRPVIQIAGPAEDQDVLALVTQAHRQCLIANSVTAAVVVDPQITVGKPG